LINSANKPKGFPTDRFTIFFIVSGPKFSKNEYFIGWVLNPY
jgi:hypothetical protein